MESPTKYEAIEVQTFLSKCFHEFCSTLDTVLEFSSSYHHSSNPAERAVRNVKTIIKKCADQKLGNSAWRFGSIEYLCTPISDQLPSLAEILNSRIYNSYQLFCDLLLGLSQALINLLKGEKKRNFTMIHLFQISQLLVKDKMWYRNHVKNIWEKGTIVHRDDISNRSYTLFGENGKILSHNHVDLKLCHTKVLHNLEDNPPSLLHSALNLMLH